MSMNESTDVYNPTDDKPYGYKFPVRDSGDKLWRKIKRIFCIHQWDWEYLSSTKKPICLRCGKHGKESYK